MENKKKAILVVSFGTSYNETRKRTIGALEKAIGQAYPAWEVRRAFTSQMIINKLAKRDQIKIDNVGEALERLAAEGVDELYVQPTHVMNGMEYDEVVEEVERCGDRFSSVVMGSPLLTTAEDYDAVVEALIGEYAPAEREALVLMGHGTEHHADAAYAALDYHFKAAGHDNVFVGTVEGYPSLDDVLGMLEKREYDKVILAPLMVVAGDHATNDMASDEEDSWKRLLSAAGYAVECRLKGLGEIPAIREIYVDHLRAAAEGGEV